MATTRQSGEAFRWLPLCLLILGIVIASAWCECRLHSVTATFEQASTGKPLDATVFKDLLDRLEKQKEARATWAYAALVGLIAISVTTRVFAIPWVRWAYIPTGAAAVLLVESIHASDIYTRRITYLILHPPVLQNDLGGISTVLWCQLQFLYLAVSLMALFVMSFLVAIVSGQMSPISVEQK